MTAGITISIDGYDAGPNDGPGKGLGEGGERLHRWVFGGPWTYGDDPRHQVTGIDREYLDETVSRIGAVIGGRGTYDAGDRWGGTNPWPVPLFILTHRHDGPGPEFTFVHDLADAFSMATSAAADKDVLIMGGGDVIRQALRDGMVRHTCHVPCRAVAAPTRHE